MEHVMSHCVTVISFDIIYSLLLTRVAALLRCLALV